MCCGQNNQVNRRGFPFFPFLPLIFFLSAVLALILVGRRRAQPARIRRPRQPDDIQLPEVMPSGSLPAPNDLTRIEGIGPKVAAVLRANGITQFRQLAAFKPPALKQILVASGNRISDPATWPEQAALAAKGNWDGLKALQSSLKGGRRTA